MNAPQADAARADIHLPGEAGIWVFVLGDMIVFSLFFGAYLFYQGQDPGHYTAAQETLHQTLGTLNTLLLLSSSWFVATGVTQVRRRRNAFAARMFGAAWLCGLAFATIKIYEYSDQLGAGHGPSTGEFYMFYFVLTGIHLLHTVIGLGVLALLRARSRADAEPDLRLIESGATYWHLVDLLWIMLFPLLYLIH